MVPVALRKILDKILVSDLGDPVRQASFGRFVARHDAEYSVCDMEHQTTSETSASQKL